MKLLGISLGLLMLENDHWDTKENSVDSLHYNMAKKLLLKLCSCAITASWGSCMYTYTYLAKL